jgi:hypothetical protein
MLALLCLIFVSFNAVSAVPGLSNCMWCSSKRVLKEVERVAQEIHYLTIDRSVEPTGSRGNNGMGLSLVYHRGKEFSESGQTKGKSVVNEVRIIYSISRQNKLHCEEMRLKAGRTYRVSGRTENNVLFVDPCGLFQETGRKWDVGKKRKGKKQNDNSDNSGTGYKIQKRIRKVQENVITPGGPRSRPRRSQVVLGLPDVVPPPKRQTASV